MPVFFISPKSQIYHKLIFAILGYCELYGIEICWFGFWSSRNCFFAILKNVESIFFFQFTTNRRHKIQTPLQIRITIITIRHPTTTMQPNPITRIRTTTKSTDRRRADESWKMSSISKKLENLWNNFGLKLRIQLIGNKNHLDHLCFPKFLNSF